MTRMDPLAQALRLPHRATMNVRPTLFEKTSNSAGLTECYLGSILCMRVVLGPVPF